MTSTLASGRHSGRHKATEKEDDRETPEERSEEGNVDSGLQVYLEEDGGGSTRQSCGLWE